MVSRSEADIFREVEQLCMTSGYIRLYADLGFRNRMRVNPLQGE
jgi:hypothetical protein